MDTLFSKVKLIGGYTCATDHQLDFHNNIVPNCFYGSVNIAAALQGFTDNVRIPATLSCDMASEKTGKNTDILMKLTHRLHITNSFLQ